MAEVEDFSNFGTHFLDSVLDFHMTEDYGPDTSDLANNPECNNGYDAEDYVDPAQLAEVEMQCTSNTESDHPIKGAKTSPISKGLAVNPYTLFNNVSTGLVINKISSGATSMSPLKATPKLSNDPAAQYRVKKSFLYNKIFRPNLSKRTFVKQDDPLLPSSEYGDEEFKYYKESFEDVSEVKYARLHCTICTRHLGCSTAIAPEIRTHRVLRVLICQKCYDFYGEGDFPKDAGDGCEIYCRWCGQGGVLICCSFCPKVFCKKCLKRNLGSGQVRSIENANVWACVCCAQKPLWPLRAICWALNKYLAQLSKDGKTEVDNAYCCIKNKPLLPPIPEKKKKGPKKKVPPSPEFVSVPNAPDNRKTITIGGPTTNGKVFPVKSSPQPRINQSFSLADLLDKGTGQTTSSTPIQSSSSTGATTRSTRSILPDIPKIPNLNDVTISRRSAAAPRTPAPVSKPSVSAPRPPAVTPRTPAPTTQGNANPLNINMSNKAMNLNEISVAKVPRNPNGMILRLKLPNNTVLLVRLVTDEESDGKDFYMPEFKNNTSKRDFLENALRDSFKLSKMMYDQLMMLKAKHESKTVSNEKTILETCTKKLQFVLKKAGELCTQIDESLDKDAEVWKTEQENKTTEVDIIDLSDEEDDINVPPHPSFKSIFTSEMGDPFKDAEELVVLDESEGDIGKQNKSEGDEEKKVEGDLTKKSEADPVKDSEPTPTEEGEGDLVKEVEADANEKSEDEPAKKTKSDEVMHTEDDLAKESQDDTEKEKKCEDEDQDTKNDSDPEKDSCISDGEETKEEEEEEEKVEDCSRNSNDNSNSVSVESADEEKIDDLKQKYDIKDCSVKIEKNEAVEIIVSSSPKRKKRKHTESDNDESDNSSKKSCVSSIESVKEIKTEVIEI